MDKIISQIEYKLLAYKAGHKQMFSTSSFQSHSLVLLHILSRIDNTIPIYFINTGFHFPETLAFRDQVAEQFGLNVIDLGSDIPKYMQRDAEGRLLFASDPDHCCHINKVQPLDAVMRSFDIWINGVRADQSATRAAMQEEQPAPHGVLRYHPMLNWTSKMVYEYQREFRLPKHPLENKGYMSIGCEPCTRKIDADMMEREARWYGLNKNECGLHTTLGAKQFVR
ncbi:MAG TPA: phosphoadenylyl-sulfate reductase [Cyclobacteriaceae bacterium]|nr:phosphoadenylyl-sulfate reductase [Cyclobacteriaceae bacterium]